MKRIEKPRKHTTHFDDCGCLSADLAEASRLLFAKERSLLKAVEALEHHFEYFQFNKKEFMASQTKNTLKEIHSSVGGGK
jgi:hypothetical protein